MQSLALLFLTEFFEVGDHGIVAISREVPQRSLELLWVIRQCVVFHKRIQNRNGEFNLLC